MATSVVNPQDMSTEQLRQYIENGQHIEQPTEGQPRDDQGRFVSPSGEKGEIIDIDPIPVEEEQAEEFEEVVERTIDLQDGSGVQLFRGVGTGATQAEALIAAHEALTDELAKAQQNATRKIQQLSRQPAPPPAQPRQATAEEDAALSHRLMQNPTEVLREVREQAARDAEERIRQQNESRAKAEADANDAAVAFVQATPDFYACPENQDRIERYMKIYGLPQTFEGITTAYDAIKDVLKQKPAPPPAAPRPRSSGISVRRAGAPPAPPATSQDEKGYQAWLESVGAADPKPFRRKF